ncbi:hypothetical protein ACH4S8_41685 [Streptomyces sp. NPDC021080]
MTAQLPDGEARSAERVAKSTAAAGRPPGLGTDPAAEAAERKANTV